MRLPTPRINSRNDVIVSYRLKRNLFLISEHPGPLLRRFHAAVHSIWTVTGKILFLRNKNLMLVHDD